MQSIQRVASLWVSSPLKPCRWTPFPFAPQAGYAKLEALFRAAHVTLGDHVDFVDRLGVVPDTVESSVFLAVDIIRPIRGFANPAGWIWTHSFLHESFVSTDSKSSRHW